MDAEHFEEELESAGELHVYLDSGKELHLHAGDVHVSMFDPEDWASVDSKKGRWGFHPSKIEHIEYPQSEI